MRVETECDPTRTVKLKPLREPHQFAHQAPDAGQSMLLSPRKVA